MAGTSAPGSWPLDVGDELPLSDTSSGEVGRQPELEQAGAPSGGRSPSPDELPLGDEPEPPAPSDHVPLEPNAARGSRISGAGAMGGGIGGSIAPNEGRGRGGRKRGRPPGRRMLFRVGQAPEEEARLVGQRQHLELAVSIPRVSPADAAPDRNLEQVIKVARRSLPDSVRVAVGPRFPPALQSYAAVASAAQLAQRPAATHDEEVGAISGVLLGDERLHVQSKAVLSGSLGVDPAKLVHTHKRLAAALFALDRGTTFSFDEALARALPRGDLVNIWDVACHDETPLPVDMREVSKEVTPARASLASGSSDILPVCNNSEALSALGGASVLPIFKLRAASENARQKVLQTHLESGRLVRVGMDLMTFFFGSTTPRLQCWTRALPGTSCALNSSWA